MCSQGGCKTRVCVIVDRRGRVRDNFPLVNQLPMASFYQTNTKCSEIKKCKSEYTWNIHTWLIYVVGPTKWNVGVVNTVLMILWLCTSIHCKTIIYYTSDVCVTEEERIPQKMWAGITCLFTASWCQFHSDKWNETCKTARHTHKHTLMCYHSDILSHPVPHPEPGTRAKTWLKPPAQHQFAFWLNWSLLLLKS